MKNSPLIYFNQIKGLCGKYNDLILLNKLGAKDKLIIYFAGDLQDTEENMRSNENAKNYVKWNLENVLNIIESKFNDHYVLAIKYSKMYKNKYANYSNFLDYDENHLIRFNYDFDALQHIEQLLKNLNKELESNSEYEHLNINLKSVDKYTFISFSVGCAVINQIMISLNELRKEIEALNENQTQNLDFNLGNSLSNSFVINNSYYFNIINVQVNKRLNEFSKKIFQFILLDPTFNSYDNQIFVQDEEIIKNLVNLRIKIQLHLTPYCFKFGNQTKHEEKEFCEKFIELNATFIRRMHFANYCNLDKHFELIQHFDDELK